MPQFLSKYMGIRLSPCIIYRGILDTGGSYCTNSALCIVSRSEPPDDNGDVDEGVALLRKSNGELAELKVKHSAQSLLQDYANVHLPQFDS